MLLSQAPGPDIAKAINEDVKAIASTDFSITPMVNAPAWNATWTTKLKPLSENSTSFSNFSEPSHSSLSGGSIAGFVIGIVAALVLVVLRKEQSCEQLCDDITTVYVYILEQQQIAS